MTTLFPGGSEGALSLPPGSTIAAPPRVGKPDKPTLHSFHLPAGSTFVQQDVEGSTPVVGPGRTRV